MIPRLLHQFYILNFTFYAIYKRKVSWALPISKRTFHADQRIEKKKQEKEEAPTNKNSNTAHQKECNIEDVHHSKKKKIFFFL